MIKLTFAIFKNRFIFHGSMKTRFFIFRIILYTFIFAGIFNSSHSKVSEFNYDAKSISNYFSGLIYLIFATILSIYYLFISYKLLKEKNTTIEKKIATKLFGYSIFYLFMIFALVLIDKIV